MSIAHRTSVAPRSKPLLTNKAKLNRILAINVALASPILTIVGKREAMPWLGKEVGPATPTPNGLGWFQHYANGSIYWSPKTGAQEVHGAIRDKWASLGWEQSFLGFPTTDELSTPSKPGRFNHFEGGSIYWSLQTGAWEVHGTIRDKWASLGWESSFLGFPISDELPIPGSAGRFNNFQNGQIAWTPDEGAAVAWTSYSSVSGGGIHPLGIGADGTPTVRRRVTLSVHLDITDDEIFSNEYGHADKTLEYFISNDQPGQTLSVVGKAGGEVRVVLTLIAKAVPSGDIRVEGEAELYEGTSDESNDLDGTTNISFVVPRDSFVQQSYTVRNEDEGGDFANINISANNQAG
jgi:LGFP repeat